MWTPNSRRIWYTVFFALCLAFGSFASNVVAQTPEATDPPVPQETIPAVTEVPTETAVPTEISLPTETVVPTEPETPTETSVPTETETPVETIVPTETETPVETSVPTATEAPTEIAVPTETSTATDSDKPGTPEPSPTATEQPNGPDQLIQIGANPVSVAPDSFTDIVVQYTLGSDRQSTELSANLTAPGGESLDQWTLTPVDRTDTDQDPNDANRDLKARIVYAESTSNGDVFQTTWRITAPDHIEKPMTLSLGFNARINTDKGVTDGAIKPNMVTITATASLHAPTVNCDAVVASGGQNTFTCAFDTTHSGDMAVTVSAEVPTGWTLMMNNAALTATATPLSAETVATGSFTLASTYAVGCPDIGATFSANLALAFQYPSGEVSTISTELPLVFTRPEPTLSISSFTISDLNLLETLTTTGAISVSYSDVPCAWQATMELTDLVSENTTIPKSAIHIQSVDGLSNSAVTIDDGSISILGTEGTNSTASGEFTIHIVIDLQEQIPPGAYSLGFTIQIGWSDQN